MFWIYLLFIKWLYPILNHDGSFILNISNPPDTVSLFAPGVISDHLANRDMAISPFLDEIFYTVQVRNGQSISTLIHIQKVGNKWSSPKIATFSGWASDLEPAFAPDGKKLYFVSNRDTNDKVKNDYDIWSIEKINSKWASPQKLPTTINSDKNEFYPQVTKSGNIYFTKEMTGQDEDIVLSTYEQGNYSQPISLPNTINTPGAEFNAYIDPNETFILFTGYKRKDNIGSGDIYISKKNSLGEWTLAQSLGTKINQKGLNYCPYISPDGKALFFSSNRTAPAQPSIKISSYSMLKEIATHPLNGSDNIYWISTKSIF